MARNKTSKSKKILCATYVIPDIKDKFYKKCYENGFSPAAQLRRFVYEYINN